jgi:hypothetical protein
MVDNLGSCFGLNVEEGIEGIEHMIQSVTSSTTKRTQNIQGTPSNRMVGSLLMQCSAALDQIISNATVDSHALRHLESLLSSINPNSKNRNDLSNLIQFAVNTKVVTEEEVELKLETIRLLIDQYIHFGDEQVLEIFGTDQESLRYISPGMRLSDLGIGFMNGIDTSFDRAKFYTDYLGGIAEGYGVELIYNQTHGKIGDMLEVLLLNYNGFSPNTADQVKEVWTKFHEENKDNPRKKYLQICHSQGGIHIRNALESCCKELRDRIIVVNIASVVVIPQDLCYRSYNYVSRKDPVNISEFVWAALKNPIFCLKNIARILEERKQLIMLEPHPNDTWLGHGFQNPVFTETIKFYIADYLNHAGEFS